MKNVRTTIVLLVLSFIFLATNITVFAQEENTALTFEEAVQLAIENSVGLKDLELNIQKEEINLDRQKIIADTPEAKRSYDYEGYVKFEYNIIPATNDYNLLFFKKVKVKNSLELDVKKLFYNILSDNENIKILSEKINLLNKQYDLAQKRRMYNLITDAEVTGLEESLASTSLLQQTAVNKVESEKRQFITLLGLEISTDKLVLEDTSSYKVLEKADLNEVLEEAYKNRFDLLELQYKVDETKALYELSNRILTEIGNTTKQNKYSYKQATNSYNTLKDTITREILSNYEALIFAEKNYLDSLKVYESSIQNHELVAKKYEFEMITSVEVDNSNISVMESYKNMKKALYDYDLAYKIFEESYKSDTFNVF